MPLKVRGIEFWLYFKRLNLSQGKPMKLDLCRMKQNGNEIISFMSQTIGMMADIDLKTEPMRWMGGTRFMVGFVAAGRTDINLLLLFTEPIPVVCVNRSCPIKLEIKVASRDKHAMLSTYRKLRSQSLASIGQSSEAELVDTVSPVLAEEEAEEEWTVVDKKLSYVWYVLLSMLVIMTHQSTIQCRKTTLRFQVCLNPNWIYKFLIFSPAILCNSPSLRAMMDSLTSLPKRG